MAKKDFRASPGINLRELEAETYGDDSGLNTILSGVSRQRATQLGIHLAEDGSFTFGKFRLQTCGMVIPDDTTTDEWQMLGRALISLQQRMQWILGDWLAYGVQREWGETFQQLASETGLEVKTLYNYAHVAAHVDFSLRKETLTFGHHNLVTGMTPDQQSHWLGLADEKAWSVNRLRLEIAGNKDNSEKPEWEVIFTKFRDRANKLDVANRKVIAEQLRQLAAELEREPQQ